MIQKRCNMTFPDSIDGRITMAFFDRVKKRKKGAFVSALVKNKLSEYGIKTERMVKDMTDKEVDEIINLVLSDTTLSVSAPTQNDLLIALSGMLNNRNNIEVTENITENDKEEKPKKVNNKKPPKEEESAPKTINDIKKGFMDIDFDSEVIEDAEDDIESSADFESALGAFE